MTQTSSWLDRLITRIANPDYDENNKRWAENEKKLEAGRERLLSSGSLTDAQTQVLRKQQFGADDIADGATQVFADEYAKQVEKKTYGFLDTFLGGILRGLPWYVWILLAGVGLFLVFPIIKPYLKK